MATSANNSDAEIVLCDMHVRYLSPKLTRLSLNTLFVGKNFIELPVVDSTNSFATDLLATNVADGTVVVATHQTAGKGQQGNAWFSEPGSNLTFSLVLYPEALEVRKVFLLNKMFSCALYDFLESIVPEQELHIKWPNDLLVNRKKVAGMLIENHLSGGYVASVVAGFGLNVNQLHFPEASYGQATSLACEMGRSFALRPLLEKLLMKIEARYLMLRAGRVDHIERDYLRQLFGYQEHVRMEIEGEEKEVFLVGVDPSGRLALQEGMKLNYYNIKEVRFCL